MGLSGCSAKSSATARIWLGLDLRLVALDIDDDLFIAGGNGLGDAIGARLMMAAGEHRLKARFAHHRDQ